MSDSFAQVEIGMLAESSFSPQVDFETFRGISIVTPSSLLVGGKGPVPICGTWVLPVEFLWKIENVTDSLVYLVRNVDNNVAASGHFRFHEEEEKDERPAFVPDEEDPDAQAQGWFHLDLLHSWKIPSTPGRFRLQLVLAHLQSNEVVFDVVEREE